MLSHDEKIRAALQAEAALAHVPADEILERIRRTGASVRQPSVWDKLRLRRVVEVAAVAALLGLVVASPLLKDSFGGKSISPASAPGTPSGPVPSASAPLAPEDDPAERTEYESRSQGFRIGFPGRFTGPNQGERGGLTFAGEQVVVTVDRRSRQVDRAVEDLLGALVAQNFKESDRLRPVDLGIDTLGGRKAAYLRVMYVSAAAGFTRQTYVIPAGQYEYSISCETVPGARVTWETVQPICQHVFDHLEVGMDQGFISAAKALAAAQAAVPGETEVTVTQLEEQFKVEGVGVVPVWRFHLVAKSGQGEYSVVVDARSGKVHYVQNMITGEKTSP